MYVVSIKPQNILRFFYNSAINVWQVYNENRASWNCYFSLNYENGLFYETQSLNL